MNRSQLDHFLAGKTLHTCNAFELADFDTERVATGHYLLVHDGTKPPGTLPDVYERVGVALRLVKWWR